LLLIFSIVAAGAVTVSTKGPIQECCRAALPRDVTPDGATKPTLGEVKADKPKLN
jgi:hypothetical protein